MGHAHPLTLRQTVIAGIRYADDYAVIWCGIAAKRECRAHPAMCPRILEPPHLDSMEIRDVGFGMQAAYSTRKRPVQMLLRRSDRHQGHEPARPCRPHGSGMKFVEPSPFNDWRGA